jgi:hypothetical protein
LSADGFIGNLTVDMENKIDLACRSVLYQSEYIFPICTACDDSVMDASKIYQQFHAPCATRTNPTLSHVSMTREDGAVGSNGHF